MHEWYRASMRGMLPVDLLIRSCAVAFNLFLRSIYEHNYSQCWAKWSLSFVHYSILVIIFTTNASVFPRRNWFQGWGCFAGGNCAFPRKHSFARYIFPPGFMIQSSSIQFTRATKPLRAFRSRHVVLFDTFFPRKETLARFLLQYTFVSYSRMKLLFARFPAVLVFDRLLVHRVQDTFARFTQDIYATVSYTHLTLPTIYSV